MIEAALVNAALRRAGASYVVGHGEEQDPALTGALLAIVEALVARIERLEVSMDERRVG